MTSGGLTRNAVQEALAFGDRRRLEPESNENRSDNRRPPRRPKGPYAISSPRKFNLNRLADVENLKKVFLLLKETGGHGAGIDRLTFDEFTNGELFSALRPLSAAIRNQSYRPYETRLVEVPKGDGRVRQLLLQIITDRVVAKALQLALDSYWRQQLPGIGRDVWRIYADMQRVMREWKAYVLAIDDVEDCFPSALIEAVLEFHRQHIAQQELLWLIEQVIRGHEGPDRMPGLHQGSPYSPVAMELLLHHCLDRRLEAAHQGFPLLLRYVDNLTFVCRSVHEGSEIIRTSGDILAEQGLRLKGKDGQPQDIRDPDFNKVLLGVIPRWQNGQLTFSIPESGFEDLRNGFVEAAIHPKPTQAAKAVAYGWTKAVGPTLVNKATQEVVDRVMKVARDCGFRELSARDLCDTAHRARKRWLVLANRRGGSTGG